MDGELGIYSKRGGGEKYTNVGTMKGGSNEKDDNNEKDGKKERIKRLEHKISILENEIKKLKENNI